MKSIQIYSKIQQKQQKHLPFHTFPRSSRTFRIYLHWSWLADLYYNKYTTTWLVQILIKNI